VTIFGWDMSHFDAPGIGSALAEDISFITHKAGGDANDAEIGAWWAAAKGQREWLLLGAYWVLYPGNPVYRADLFLARLDATCPGWRDGPFILQADCEKWNGDAGTVPSKAEIKAFCDRLQYRMPKLQPVVYAPKWVYGDSLSGLGYPLWASSYVTNAGGFKALYPGDSSSRWAAYSGQTPAILQYTSSATIGGQTTCDANAYRGTLAQLTALVAPGWSNLLEDDVSEQDVTNALTKFFAAAPRPGAADTLPENVIGDRGWKQPLPNPLRGTTDPATQQTTVPRTLAYQLLADIATVIGRIPTAEETAAAVLAALGAADLDAAAASLRAVLGDERAAQLGALLAPGPA
jgi:hypothetical protein